MKMLFPEFTKEQQEYIEDIRSKIDFEHSIAIHYPTSGGLKSIYIVEFKTEDPNRKVSFAFNVVDVNFALVSNFYVAAIYTRDVLNKIPVWHAQWRQKMACPETGSFTAYKQVIGNDNNKYVCELLIPKDANRLGGFERKCRTNEAKVVAMWELDFVDPDGAVHFRKTRKRVGYSIYKHRERRHANTITFIGEKIYKKSTDFVYRVGETVRPENGFDTDRFNTCAPGIHFFMTMMEAYTYRF